MKEILQKISKVLGYVILPIDPDPIQKILIETYRKLRFAGENKAERGTALSRVAFAEHLRQLLERYRISTVIDVGANKGQFGLLLREIGFRGTILSFEPMPAASDCIRKIAIKNGPWNVYPFALGSSRGDFDLQILADDTCSSIHKVKQESRSEFGPAFDVQKTVRVKGETLDHLFSEIILNPTAEKILLKTDTQGHDLEVLRGAQETMKKTLVILTEAATQVVYENAPDFQETIQYLGKCGFTPSGFYPFCHKLDSLALVELDAFFVRKPAGESSQGQKSG